MPLSWNEIRQRAIAFSREWSDPNRASRERAEAQTFWNEFFDVFGVRRRTVASFEAPVRDLKGTGYGFIDLLWKGKLLAEHKSRGRDLSKAESQAHDYIQRLVSDDRHDEVPRYLIVSDFARVALHDLEEDTTLQFDVGDLHEHVHAFGFIPGYQTRQLDPEDEANFKATRLLAELHDAVEDGGYPAHDLERFLVRVLFCLFAEDTGLFEPDSFRLWILNHTRPDGSDLGPQLARLFDVLNTPRDRRQKNLDEDLALLPYVNGDLFAERLPFVDFNAQMRSKLLACCNFRWSEISPAIFGSLFQSVMEPRERRQIGAHYTSERDILKLIRSLFLDALRDEFERARQTSRPALRRFHDKLGRLRFLDPACGCGNFLVITYRELRLLEIDLLRALHPQEVQGRLDFDLAQRIARQRRPDARH